MQRTYFNKRAANKMRDFEKVVAVFGILLVGN